MWRLDWMRSPAPARARAGVRALEPWIFILASTLHDRPRIGGTKGDGHAGETAGIETPLPAGTGLYPDFI